MNLKLFSAIPLLILTTNVVAQTKQNELPIKSIELIHCTHTDYGFTDNPVIVLDLQKRYLDIALDAIIETSDSTDNKKFGLPKVLILSIYGGRKLLLKEGSFLQKQLNRAKWISALLHLICNAMLIPDNGTFFLIGFRPI
jgi:hypothetical protein